MPALSPSELAALHQAREVLLAWGLAVLAAWVLLNLLGSGYGLSQADRHHERFYFHGLNVMWAFGNATLAAWGIWHLQLAAPPGLRLADVVREQLFNENLFMLNTGLDAAYIMTGYYLRTLAQVPEQPNPARLLGFGRSLWVQGGFLLVFDAIMWTLLHGQSKGLLVYLSNKP